MTINQVCLACYDILIFIRLRWGGDVLSDLKIGVLALQGDFAAHEKILNNLGVEVIQVRTSLQLADINGLILPGGESTTISILMEGEGLDTAIRSRAAEGLAVYGTCAGLILMAKHIQDRPNQSSLGLMDITVARNAFGRQIDSFEADVACRLSEDGGEVDVRGVFIRAPYVVDIGAGASEIASYEGRIVAVKQDNLLGTAFHPELTGDTRFHMHFLELVRAFSEKPLRILS